MRKRLMNFSRFMFRSSIWRERPSRTAASSDRGRLRRHDADIGEFGSRSRAIWRGFAGAAPPFGARSSFIARAARRRSPCQPATAVKSSAPSPVSSVTSRTTLPARSTRRRRCRRDRAFRRKIPAPRVGGVRPHDAEQERAVAAAQRAHREAVDRVGVGKVPVAPGEEAREVGLRSRRRPRLRLAI